MIREEPERFFLPVNSGIMTQPEYNKIIGVPEDYKPKIKPWIVQACNFRFEYDAYSFDKISTKRLYNPQISFSRFLMIEETTWPSQ